MSMQNNAYTQQASAVVRNATTTDLATAFEAWDGCSYIILPNTSFELVGDDVYFELIRRGCAPAI